MPEGTALSQKSRPGQEVVVRRTRRRRNNLSRGLRWRNRKRSRRASYGRVLYNYFRTYDPATGRYLESDPIGLDGGLNTYRYAEANPLSYIDPDGRLAWFGIPIYYWAVGGGAAAAGAWWYYTNPWSPVRDSTSGPMLSERDDDNVITFPIDVRDPNGSGNSDRAKECRRMCGDAHIGTGAGSEWRFRECLRKCMADLDFCP